MKFFVLLLVVLCFFVAGNALAASWKAEGPWFGTINALVSDPANADTLYAASQGGGIWKSTDGGGSWVQSGTELTNRAPLWIQFQPGSPKTLYVGVEEAGISKSIDGGATWKWIKFPFGSLSTHPHRFAFAPGNPKVMWLADVNLHYRSIDGGVTWKDFRVPDSDVSVFTFDLKDPKTVWAGGVDGKTGLRKTTDGGATWKPMGAGLPESNHIVDLILDPANAKVMYMRSTWKLFKSSDGGVNWSELDLQNKGTSDIDMFMLDPTKPGTLYAGTEDGFKWSEDGGETWGSLDAELPNYIVRGLVVSTAKPGTLWAGTAGRGVYKSTNAGENWVESSQGLGSAWVTKIWAGAGDNPLLVQTTTGLFRRDSSGKWIELVKPFDDDEAELRDVLIDTRPPQTIYATTSSSLFRSTDGGATWSKPDKPMQDVNPGECVAIEPSDPKVLYACPWSPDKPEQTVIRSTDKGVKWKASGKGLPGDDVVILRTLGPKTLLAVTEKKEIYRSVDGAMTWTKAGSGFSASELRAVVVNPADGTKLFAATKEGVLRSTDGGQTWSAANQGLKDTDVESVAIAPSGAVYAATFDGVSRSTDGGATWTLISAGIPNQYARALAVQGTRLYVGTGGGSMFTTDIP